jgi:D-alanyl-D-alanine carboxypeptidase
MAKRRKKKNFLDKNVVLASIFVVATLFLILVFSLVKNSLNNQDKSDASSTTQSEISTTTTITQASTTESTTETTTEYIKPETTTEPITATPTGSFYDGVVYRSPIAVPADIFKHGRELMLLNKYYELPEDFEWNLVLWSNGNSVDAMYLNTLDRKSIIAVDRAAYEPLKQMFADAEAAGCPLQLISAYRSIVLQDNLFGRSVTKYMNQGLSKEDAINKANLERTFTGTSEHNTGLGFDILEKGNYTLYYDFDKTPQFEWLMENAENYGFILRYKEDKTDITEIMYEPWHFRYVGVEHAKRINELDMCLEEYIAYLDESNV